LKKEKTGHFKSLFLRQNLSFKIIFYIGILLVTAILISFYLINEAHEKELINLTKLQTHRLTDTIKTSIRQDMINHGSHNQIQTLLEAIGDRDDIIKVSIWDRGNIKASSWREEVGEKCKKDDKDCALCHYSDVRPPLTILNYRIYKDKGKRFLTLFNPISNEPLCYRCHAKEKEMLGVLKIVTSLSRMDKSIVAGKKYVIISTIIIFLLVSLEIFYCIYRFVHCPIQKLTLATKRVSDGDVDYHISVSSADEVGELARSFNSMTEKLKKSWSEIEAWNHELEKRVEVATAQLKKANQDLLSTNQRLQIADQKKTDILVTVAHDIRGPLAAIKGCIDVVLGGYISNDQKKQNDMLQRVEQRAKELLRFTNDLLDLSLIEESWQEKEDIDCARLLDTIIPDLKNKADEKQISLNCQVTDKPILIKGDKKLFSKVFFYIIENAVKYSRPEGKVYIRLSCQEKNLLFKVKDEGIGIPEKELPCIFEPTFPGEAARCHDKSGTGVSMALVEKIINLYKGKISIESVVEKGTTVEIFLNSLVEAKVG